MWRWRRDHSGSSAAGALAAIWWIVEHAEDTHIGTSRAAGAQRGQERRHRPEATDADEAAAAAALGAAIGAMRRAVGEGDFDAADDAGERAAAARQELAERRTSAMRRRLQDRAVDAQGEARRSAAAAAVIRAFLRKRARGNTAPPHQWRAVHDVATGRDVNGDRTVLGVLQRHVATAHNEASIRACNEADVSICSGARHRVLGSCPACAPPLR